MDKHGNEVSHFTQWDIADGNLWFNPAGDIPEWTTMDFFTFSAQAGPARTAHRSFYIQITYERENGISLGRFSRSFLGQLRSSTRSKPITAP